MVTGILSMAFVWFLFAGKAPNTILAAACIALGAFFWHFSRHQHDHPLPIDIIAQSSKLNGVNASLKFWTVLASIAICISSKNCYTGIFLMAIAPVIAVYAGGMDFDHYLQILMLPLGFLLLSGLSLLFSVSMTQIEGVASFRALGIWFYATTSSQAMAALVVSRALGAVSCLCILSVTTRMPDIIAVLRRSHCPDAIIDLMYLVYRYIFILMSLHHEMHDAAKSRLGMKDYKTSLRSTGMVYANLLARSYHFAAKNFDAMESRCYDTGIRFLEHSTKITMTQGWVCAVLLAVGAALSLMPL
ncbi:MAG: cobalt ECF transporter T component CbiQ [Eubacteriaceae bacterium]|nr:cobalt ECF transporter T component CbiQ [Eubacteriaceae bacterium]